MKAGDELLGTVFNKDHRYVIPIFQRPYVWDEEDNWAPLWHDIRKAAEEVESEGVDGAPEAPHEYFLGAFVTQHRPPLPRRIATSHVIDGQQRLTTFQVFLAAARRVAHAVGADSAGDRVAALVRNRVASDSDHPGDAYKVTPLRTDEEAFRWAMRDVGVTTSAPDSDHRLAKASAWF